MSLREYTRKRSFRETPEPAPDVLLKGHGTRPIFVVQLHHARRRHYDFRLEIDGALKSWAVPKGPSYRAGEKRLAVEVEDHPLSYATFEGDIPEGHYGAGHVDIFDHGVWSSEGDPLEAVARGKLDFTLHGRKLQGAWKLVRTAKVEGGKPQWLLIKRDDEYVRDLEADDLLDAPDAPPPARARRANGNGTAKPRPASATRSSTRAPRIDWAKRAAALPGARPARSIEPIKPQLASLRETPPVGDGWLHELKWDGYRMLADVAEGRARLRSRNDLDWTNEHPDIAVALERLGVRDAVFDGELIALDARGRDDFAALQRTLEGSANASLRYVLFDLMRLEGIDLTGVPLVERKQLLQALLERAPDPLLAYSQHIVGHGADVFAASAKQGMEGIISKAVDSRYSPGRTTSWVKVKHAQTDEFVVVGYTAPKRSRQGFGALLLATREHGQLRYVGRVGTGYDDVTLRQLAQRMAPLKRAKPTVALPAHIAQLPRDVTWIEPKLVAEIEFRGWGKEGLVRQGSFQRLREDKTVEDVMPQTPGPVISSPDKLIYPESKITKQQVADYYRAIAHLLLPEVARRPLSMIRCPDGIKGPCFFQKHHAETLGANVRSVAIKEKEGDRENYVYIDSADGLLDLVQMNVLELHPWGSRIDDVERPDRLVFDLDPGEGVDWKAVSTAARDVRDRLADIGLKSFLRTSGGKGLHVVVPIAPEQTWPKVKAFCEAFADAMATQAPQRYVATASKAKRKGVIFIDWLRNGRGATSVASWSLRARANAPVAVPIRWDELGRVKSGAEYDMARALRRAANQRKDPWEGWSAATRQKLPKLG
ncbi:MAG TPA: DNA ligase D [Lysobacter sp.]|nr:DNA ligase D [Lysobacter sp.]